jgi:hypothetical protein
MTPDMKGRYWIECGRAFGFAGAEVESRMVPRTPDRLAHHEPLRQRAAIVCAYGTRREYLFALTHHDHWLAIEVAQQGFIFCKSVVFNARPEIGSR